MIIRVFNSDLEVIANVDAFESLIWTDRYAEAGDFELVVPYFPAEDQPWKTDNLLMIPESNSIMMIEELTVTPERSLLIKGPSAAKLLDRRVSAHIVSSDLVGPLVEDVVSYILDTNVVNPVDPSRKLSRFVYKPSDDSVVYKMEMNDQLAPGLIYDILTLITQSRGLGFLVSLSEDRNIVLELYFGVDHTGADPKIPRVEFSRQFDNIIEDSYYVSDADMKNLIVVKTDDEIPMLQLIQVYDGESPPDGWGRREELIDGAGVSRQREDGSEIRDEEMLLLLLQRGFDALDDASPLRIFDGEVVLNGAFEYGKDFRLGDIVLYVAANESTPARVVETIHSFTEAGVQTYISFDFNV